MKSYREGDPRQEMMTWSGLASQGWENEKEGRNTRGKKCVCESSWVLCGEHLLWEGLELIRPTHVQGRLKTALLTINQRVLQILQQQHRSICLNLLQITGVWFSVQSSFNNLKNAFRRINNKAWLILCNVPQERLFVLLMVISARVGTWSDRHWNMGILFEFKNEF